MIINMGFTLYNFETAYKKHYDFKDKSIIIGKRDLAEGFIKTGLTAPDFSYVSRRHFAISRLEKQFLIIDLSKNGTCVNGIKIYSAAELKNGDLIRPGPADMDKATGLYFLVDGQAIDEFISRLKGEQHE